MKKIKPITQEEIDAMSDVQKRRLLVKDILWQIDNDQLDSEDTGYLTNIRENKCTVCAIGAGYVTARKITGKEIEHEQGTHRYFEEMLDFGFTVTELRDIENVFEDRDYPYDRFRSLREVLDRLYPAEINEDVIFDRTKRLRALYQYIWDNKDCNMVPLEGSEE